MNDSTTTTREIPYALAAGIGSVFSLTEAAHRVLSTVETMLGQMAETQDADTSRGLLADTLRDVHGSIMEMLDENRTLYDAIALEDEPSLPMPAAEAPGQEDVERRIVSAVQDALVRAKEHASSGDGTFDVGVVMASISEGSPSPEESISVAVQRLATAAAVNVGGDVEFIVGRTAVDPAERLRLVSDYVRDHTRLNAAIRRGIVEAIS